MTYENQPNYVDETLGKKFTVSAGNQQKNLIVMVPTKCLTRENHLWNLKPAKPKEWLFVTVANPANYPFVTPLTQSCSFQ